MPSFLVDLCSHLLESVLLIYVDLPTTNLMLKLLGVFQDGQELAVSGDDFSPLHYRGGTYSGLARYMSWSLRSSCCRGREDSW